MKEKQKHSDDEGATRLEHLDEELRQFGAFIASLPIPAETRRLWDQLQFQLIRQFEKEGNEGRDKDKK